MTRLICFVLAFLLLVVQWGCGGSPENNSAPAVTDNQQSISAQPVQLEFSLQYGDLSSEYTYSAERQSWADSLVHNIGHRGDVHIFLAANNHPTDPAGNRNGSAYIELGNSQLALVQQGNGRNVIIDFKKGQVGTMGTNGLSLHPHPDGVMVVCLNPVPAQGILGVPLSDTYKTESPKPIFNNSMVSWSWGAIGQQGGQPDAASRCPLP